MGDRLVVRRRDIMLPHISCATCRHLHLDGKRECEAYPVEIPIVIQIGEHNHRKPYKGDQGIRYEKVKP